jgi:hypothetical protein
MIAIATVGGRSDLHVEGIIAAFHGESFLSTQVRRIHKLHLRCLGICIRLCPLYWFMVMLELRGMFRHIGTKGKFMDPIYYACIVLQLFRYELSILWLISI